MSNGNGVEHEQGGSASLKPVCDLAESLMNQLPTSASDPVLNKSINSLLSNLGCLSEAQLHQLLAVVLMKLSEASTHAWAEDETATMAQSLRKEREASAGLRDRVAALEASLAHRDTQCEAEKSRADKLERILEEQRGRMEALQKDNETLNIKLRAKETEIQDLNRAKELLEHDAQRARKAAADRTVLDKVLAENNELRRQLKAITAEASALRNDKDGEIAALKEAVRAESQKKSRESEVMLTILWNRMASAKPPLCPGNQQPSSRTAGRLVDAFIELVRFCDCYDQALQSFISRYVKDHPAIRTLWDSYTRHETLLQSVRETISPVNGRPVGALKARLTLLRSWSVSTLVCCDSTIESVCSELTAWLHDNSGRHPWNPHSRICDFLRCDGPELFLEHLRSLCGTRLGETVAKAG